MSQSSLIATRIEELRSLLPEGVQLVAVSKFKPVEDIMAAYEAGQRLFGESRVQEFLEKSPRLPADIKWHFIGHLQTNKVRQLIGKTALIESVDSVRLLKLIDSESRARDLVTSVLLQVHVAAEETKFGFSADELRAFISSGDFLSLNNVYICGLMAMATNTDHVDIVRRDFAEAAALFREVKQAIGVNPLTLEPLQPFRILSMGMSGDWPVAVEEGANLIRVGSAIFGER